MKPCPQTGEYAKALAAGFGTDASSSRILAFKNKVTLMRSDDYPPFPVDGRHPSLERSGGRSCIASSRWN